MTPLRNKFLVKEQGKVTGRSSQLILLESKKEGGFKRVKVVNTHPEEREVRSGDVLIVKEESGIPVSMDGQLFDIIHKSDIIKID